MAGKQQRYEQMDHDALVSEARNKGIANPESLPDEQLIEQLQSQSQDDDQ